RREPSKSLSSQPIQRTRASARAERAETVSVWLRRAHKYPEIHGCFVTVTEWQQVSAHARLVGDDRCVLRITLAIAAVGTRSVVHSPARDVEQVLVVVEQQCDQQRCAARVQIDRPLNRAAVS